MGCSLPGKPTHVEVIRRIAESLGEFTVSDIVETLADRRLKSSRAAREMPNRDRVRAVLHANKWAVVITRGKALTMRYRYIGKA